MNIKRKLFKIKTRATNAIALAERIWGTTPEVEDARDAVVRAAIRARDGRGPLETFTAEESGAVKIGRTLIPAHTDDLELWRSVDAMWAVERDLKRRGELD